MGTLHITPGWENPGGAKGAELRATWASLEISIAGGGRTESITRLVDRSADAVRSRLYLPLYPLAEWLAFHWFQLLYGSLRTSERDHDLRLASEGFAFPSLRIGAEGERTRLEWSRWTHEGAQIEFLEEGKVSLPRTQVETALSVFVRSVVMRLEDRGISGSPLQAEWAALQELPEDERRFCAVAGALGMDPFDLDPATATSIARLDDLLPTTILREFLPAAAGANFEGEAEGLVSALTSLEGLPIRARARPLAQIGHRSAIGLLPWERGYEAARGVRDTLGLGEGRIRTEDLDALLTPVPIPSLSSLPRVDGVVMRRDASETAGVSPAFEQKVPQGRRFIQARLLGEVVMSEVGSRQIVTHELTDRQAANRAFAAELLVPSSTLRARLTGPRIAAAEVEDLADQFEVSTQVVDLQIRNHRLATIDSDTN